MEYDSEMVKNHECKKIMKKHSDYGEINRKIMRKEDNH